MVTVKEAVESRRPFLGASGAGGRDGVLGTDRAHSGVRRDGILGRGKGVEAGGSGGQLLRGGPLTLPRRGSLTPA